MDDLLIPVDQALNTLREVFDLLQGSGFTLKLAKCFFLKTEIEYLGYVISESRFRPSELKLEAVKHFPTPKNGHQVRQFVGLTGYFRRFIQNYSSISKPLSCYIRKHLGFGMMSKQGHLLF